MQAVIRTMAVIIKSDFTAESYVDALNHVH